MTDCACCSVEIKRVLLVPPTIFVLVKYVLGTLEFWQIISTIHSISICTVDIVTVCKIIGSFTRSDGMTRQLLSSSCRSRYTQSEQSALFFLQESWRVGNFAVHVILLFSQGRVCRVLFGVQLKIRQVRRCYFFDPYSYAYV